MNATSAFAVFFCVLCKSKVKMYIHILLYIQILYVHTELQLCASEGGEEKINLTRKGNRDSLLEIWWMSSAMPITETK